MIQSVATSFPFQYRRVYLDNNATTAVDPIVFERMRPFLEGGEQEESKFGNPNSLHQHGIEANLATRKSLSEVYSLVGAKEEDSVVITSGATESNNTVLKGLFDHEGRKMIRNGIKPVFVTSTIEHPSVSRTLSKISEEGAEIISIPPKSGTNGTISASDIALKLQSVIQKQQKKGDTSQRRVLLVSIMFANNETGIINDIQEISKVCKSFGILFHSDATQAFGKVDLKQIIKSTSMADYLSFSGHKIHSPKGIGGLLIRNGKPVNSIDPLINGGEQMGGLRSGTLNVPGIIGLGAAASLLQSENYNEITIPSIRKLRNQLEELIISKVKDIEIIGMKEQRTSNTSLISFHGVEGESLIFDLNKNFGVSVSTGSACASESLQPSPAMSQVGGQYAHTGVRFSLSKFTTNEDIDYVSNAVSLSVSRLRSFSTQNNPKNSKTQAMNCFH